MPLHSPTTVRTAFTLSFAALLVVGCSGSGSGTDVSDALPSAASVTDEVDAVSPSLGTVVDDSNVLDDETTNETIVGSPAVIPIAPPNDTPNDDPIDNPNDTIANGEGDAELVTAVPDPLVQNTTRVEFGITVPAYSSNELQVRITWGDKDINAGWVGDEFWSTADDFPTDTENLLSVTFNDGNGAITLGSFDMNFRTGTNASQTFTINADQFDTDSWDNDADGVSNLDELIAGTDALESPRVLLFSETRDFRHDSTETALVALEELAASAGMQTDRAADSSGLFTDTNLANYDAVVWVQTSGDVLNEDEQAAFERYIRNGGGYAGIHAASFTEYEWPWYGRLVGAYFDSHPEIQSATQDVENRTHTSTAHLGARWTRTDEWYDYRTNPRSMVNVLLSLDESSYTGGAMGDDHPSAWFHDFDGGRSWYTGGGHTDASYAEPDFREHLLGGLRYAVER